MAGSKRRGWRGSVGLGVVLAGTLAACSSTEDAEALFGGDGAAPTPTTTGGTGGDDSTGSQPVNPGDTANGAPASSGVGTPASASAAQGSGGAGSGGPGDQGAGAGPANGSVRCGQGDCQGSACLLSFEAAACDHCEDQPTPDGCSPDTQAYLPLACDDGADCPDGTLCCGLWNGQQYVGAITCEAECGESGLQPVVLCEEPTECPDGLGCAESGYLGPNYEVCK